MLSKPAGPKVSQTLLKLVILIIGLAVFTLAGLICFLALTNSFKLISVPHNTAVTPTPRTAVQTEARKGLPISLKIPSINVDAIIAYAGLTPDGAMDIKKDPSEVAWYDLGPRPGESGSAVIAGHYGFLNGKGSVFNELHTLNKGDKLSVIDENGITTSFVVSESREYDPAADTSSVFKSYDGKAHLNLITCEGDWKQAQETYSSRRVVFTDKVGE